MTFNSFRALCTGEKVSEKGNRLCYQGAIFDRIIAPEYIIQGGKICFEGEGDNTDKGEDVGMSIYETEFSSENLGWREIDERGLVCMAHKQGNVDTNGSEFFITLQPELHIEQDFPCTIFGKVVMGMDILENLGDVEVDENDRPYETEQVTIVRCGELEYKAKKKKKKTKGGEDNKTAGTDISEADFSSQSKPIVPIDTNKEVSVQNSLENQSVNPLTDERDTKSKLNNSALISEEKTPKNENLEAKQDKEKKEVYSSERRRRDSRSISKNELRDDSRERDGDRYRRRYSYEDKEYDRDQRYSRGYRDTANNERENSRSSFDRQYRDDRGYNDTRTQNQNQNDKIRNNDENTGSGVVVKGRGSHKFRGEDESSRNTKFSRYSHGNRRSYYDNRYRRDNSHNYDHGNDNDYGRLT